jgi:hypothetical protein
MQPPPTRYKLIRDQEIAYTILRFVDWKKGDLVKFGTGRRRWRVAEIVPYQSILKVFHAS